MGKKWERFIVIFLCISVCFSAFLIFAAPPLKDGFIAKNGLVTGIKEYNALKSKIRTLGGVEYSLVEKGARPESVFEITVQTDKKWLKFIRCKNPAIFTVTAEDAKELKIGLPYKAPAPAK
jgi:hypothetical protein